MSQEVYKEIVVVLLVVVLVMLLLLVNVLGNSATATNADNSNKLGNIPASAYKVKEDFAILTGNIAMANGEGILDDIDLPSGFTSDNCVVLSAMFHGTSDVSKFAYGYLEKSTAYIAGAIGHCITLKNTNKLKIVIGNPTDSNNGNCNFGYKIVLMKI